LKPIRILSPQLDLLAEIDDYEYLSYDRSFHGVGQFELRINRHKNHVEHLQKRNLILISNERENETGVVNLSWDTHKVGKILHREIGLDQSGKISEQWIIKGIALKGVTYQRITVPPSTTAYDNKQGNAETVMQHYVSNNIVNPVDVNRKIDIIQMAPNQNRGLSVSWQSRYKNLADELGEISFVSGLGWNVSVDLTNKRYIFDVQQGRDLTVNQAVNPPVIFSPDFESIKTQQLADSDLNYKNFGYIGGQGEGAAREIVTTGTAIGLDRIETFIDARDIEDSALLPERGQQKMKEFETELYLEAEILTPIKRIYYERDFHFVSSTQITETKTPRYKLYSSFIYEKDYDLGDIVTVQNRGWGVTLDTRIINIKEIVEPDGFKLEATFGSNRPTLITKLKQQFSQMEAEVKR
jgi:hypothetical protein